MLTAGSRGLGRKNGTGRPAGRPVQLVKKALLQGVPAPEGDGIKLNPVISGGVYLGNDTSHERFPDNFARNRGKAFVQSFSKKWSRHFFDSLNRASHRTPGSRFVEKPHARRSTAAERPFPYVREAV